jgi:hypothetical protein
VITNKRKTSKQLFLGTDDVELTVPLRPFSPFSLPELLDFFFLLFFAALLNSESTVLRVRRKQKRKEKLDIHRGANGEVLTLMRWSRCLHCC